MNLQKYRTYLKYYPLTVLVIVAVTTLCLIPISDPPMKDVPFIDKWTHIVLFGGIALVLFFELFLNGRKCLLHLTPFIAGAYGGLIELAQANLTTYRSGEWLDFWADLTGAVLAYLLGVLVLKFCRSQQHAQ